MPKKYTGTQIEQLVQLYDRYPGRKFTGADIAKELGVSKESAWGLMFRYKHLQKHQPIKEAKAEVAPVKTRADRFRSTASFIGLERAYEILAELSRKLEKDMEP